MRPDAARWPAAALDGGRAGLALLLTLSIVGLPAGLLLAVFTVILIYLGKIVMALALGLLLIRPVRLLNRRG